MYALPYVLLIRLHRAAIDAREPHDDGLAYACGHGNLKLTPLEVANLRRYLTTGGFLWVDDDFGIDPSFRREMKRVFPDSPIVELPFSHPIFHELYEFPHGLPKIHEHDGGPAKAFGIFHDGRLVVL